jgi:hypothetical protein
MRFFTSDFFFHEPTRFQGQKYAENCGSEALKLRTLSCGLQKKLRLLNCEVVGCGATLQKVVELRLRKCFLQVAELRLRTQKKLCVPTSAKSTLCDDIPSNYLAMSLIT